MHEPEFGDVMRARIHAYEQQILSSDKVVLATEAFFPFPDGLVAAAEAGIKNILAPGGSKYDEDVIRAADKRNVAMIFTGIRHFKH